MEKEGISITMQEREINKNNFSQVIKKIRKEKGLTQQELANIVGITATGVSYWESGNAVPNTRTLNKIANYFGVTVNFLLGIKDKIEMEDNSRTTILFRKIEQVTPKEKEKLLDILDNIIDIFLEKNKNK